MHTLFGSLKGARLWSGTFFLGVFLLFSLSWAMAAPSEESKHLARHGRMPFKTRYLYPGGRVELAVDWLSQPEERILLLTFDDGPDARDLKIAELLAKQAIPAAFFYVGRKMKAMPEIVEAIRAAQYEIGYHSHGHAHLSGLSQSRLTEDFAQGRSLLQHLGVPVRWFRPPYGDFDARVLQAAQDHGMETLLWSIDSRDWAGIGAQTLASNVIRQLHPGAVLLFHSTRAATLAALPAIVQAAHRAHYRFVTLDEWRRVVRAAQGRVQGESDQTSEREGEVPEPLP
ncbi:MAG: polysaccharide deacetylase family protein [Magnetococcales bacterium]|nr:polysaccharide deacetylase family protein [Magnetococcales bacterium]